MNLESLFAGREAESAAFAAALAEHRARLRESPVAGQGRNVLTFYGMGGLGKSALSRRLQAWIDGSEDPPTGWGEQPPIPVAATTRLDLRDSGGRVDPALLLVRLRAGLGRIKPEWPAFDIAFATYWAASRPGEPFPLSSDDEGAFSTAVSSLLGAAASDLLLTAGPPISHASATLGELFARAVSSSWESFVGWTKTRIPREPTGYEGLLSELRLAPAVGEASLDVIARLAALLAVEIDAAPGPDGADRGALAVVFVDTFERLELDPRHEGEDIVNRVVWEMPNVLFVVTGRSPLGWSDLRSPGVRRRGPRVWPLLEPASEGGEPRQHCLDRLSEADAERVLTDLCGRHGIELDPSFVEAVARASGGNPKYLDTVRDAAVVSRENGASFSHAALAGSLDGLIECFLEGVPHDEQRVIRALALLGTADAELAAAAAGVEVGAALRALSRTLVDPAGSLDSPYTLHDSTREVLLEGSSGLSNGWSEQDWQAAGSRALTLLRDRWRDAIASYTAEEDRLSPDAATRSFRVLAAAIRIICTVECRPDPADREVYGDWITEAIAWGPSMAGLYPHLPASSRTPVGRLYLDLIAAKDSSRAAKEREALLSGVAEAEHPIARVALRHLAYLLESQGEWDRAIERWNAFIAGRPASAAFGQRQRDKVLVIARRYRQAQTALSRMGPGARRRTELRIRFDHGFPTEWLQDLEERLRDPTQLRNPKERLEVLGTRIRHHALLDHVAPDEVDDLRVRAKAAGHDTTTRDALAAAVLEGTESAGALEMLERMDRLRNDGRIGVRSAVALGATGFLTGDSELLERLQADIVGLGRPRSRMWIPVEALFRLSHRPLPDEPTEWLEPSAVVYDRWGRFWEQWHRRRTAELRPGHEL